MNNLQDKEESIINYVSSLVRQITKSRSFWIYLVLAALAVYISYKDYGLLYTIRYYLLFIGFFYLTYFFFEFYNVIKYQSTPKSKLTFHVIIFFLLLLSSILLLSWYQIGEMVVLSLGAALLWHLVKWLIKLFKSK